MGNPSTAVVAQYGAVPVAATALVGACYVVPVFPAGKSRRYNIDGPPTVVVPLTLGVSEGKHVANIEKKEVQVCTSTVIRVVPTVVQMYKVPLREVSA